jgi:hypothetical protein
MTRCGIVRRRCCRLRSTRLGLEYETKEGDGAFYGPKIDFDVADAIGRTWQLGTIQLDYAAPERFDLVVSGEDNQEHRPVVIHRAIFGSFERFIAILIEHFAGDFPLWLSPRAGARAAHQRRRRDDAPVRLRTDAARRRHPRHCRRPGETLNYKIREAEMQKVPYMAVIGAREKEAGTVAVRHQNGAAARVASRRWCDSPIGRKVTPRVYRGRHSRAMAVVVSPPGASGQRPAAAVSQLPPPSASCLRRRQPAASAASGRPQCCPTASHRPPTRLTQRPPAGSFQP